MRYILHTPNFSENNGVFRVSYDGCSKEELVTEVIKNELLTNDHIDLIPTLQVSDLATFNKYATAKQRKLVADTIAFAERAESQNDSLSFLM